MVSYEDFTTYTEVDPDFNRIQFTATHIDHVARRDEFTAMYDDKGVDYFGSNFTHMIDVKEVASESSSFAALWNLQKTVGDLHTIRAGSGDYLAMIFYRAVNERRLYLEEFDSGVQDNDYYVVSDGTWYYLVIKKASTSLTCKIYSDSARTNLLDTLSLTITDKSYRYVFACNTYNDGNAIQATTDIEKLALSIWKISGVTRDSSGNALGGCTVLLFQSSDKKYVESTTSDGSGNYSFDVGNPTTEYFVRAYKDGTPNVFGTTDDDLTGS